MEEIVRSARNWITCWLREMKVWRFKFACFSDCKNIWNRGYFLLLLGFHCLVYTFLDSVSKTEKIPLSISCLPNSSTEEINSPILSYPPFDDASTRFFGLIATTLGLLLTLAFPLSYTASRLLGSVSIPFSPFERFSSLSRTCDTRVLFASAEGWSSLMSRISSLWTMLSSLKFAMKEGSMGSVVFVSFLKSSIIYPFYFPIFSDFISLTAISLITSGDS